MHDLGGLLWVLIVIIGVVSSIVKNVNKTAARPTAQRRAARSAWSQPPAGPQKPSAVPSRPATGPSPSAGTLPPPIARPPVAMGTTSAPRQASAAPQAALDDTGGMGALQLPASFHLDYVAGKRSAGFLVGMFKKKNAFVRAIVAAEVLGKPKALQEQSIWSPRYSEPSI